MRRRPEPNVRRGLLRAAAVVVVLTLILLGIIAVVSSLTAPKANAPTAPTPPPSPAAIRSTPSPGGKASTPKPAKPKATAAPTHKTKKDIAMQTGVRLRMNEAGPGSRSGSMSLALRAMVGGPEDRTLPA